MAEIEATGPNAEQIKFWNDNAGRTWVTHQERMDRMLGNLGNAAVKAAAVRPGERALDVGCGCGATALAMADLGASVTGVDISAPMLAHARTRAQSAGADAEFVLADAMHHAFSGDFDLVFSRFGVMFFADLTAAFANLRAALKPGGRLCTLVWQTPPNNPWLALPIAAATAELPPAETPPDGQGPGPFALGDTDYASEVLTGAGFTDIEIEQCALDLRVGSSVDDALTFYTDVGPMQNTLADAQPDARARALDAVRAVLETHLGDSGVQMGAACWILRAVNPI